MWGAEVANAGSTSPLPSRCSNDDDDIIRSVTQDVIMFTTNSHELRTFVDVHQHQPISRKSIEATTPPFRTLNTMATTSSAGTHASRKPSSSEQELIDDVLKLYQLEPTEKAYRHYSPNAVFHDPVSIAEGLDSIRSQFNGMPKVFAESTTQKCDVLADSEPNTIAINLTQHYVFKSPIPFKSKGTEKTVNSKVTFHLNSEGLIEKHDEEWDHQENSTENDGFMGKLMESRKKIDAKLVQKAIPSDPSKV